jgi:amidohydrolase
VSSDARPDLQRFLDGFLEARRDELVAFRRHLHAHPELSFEEHQTTELVAERLGSVALQPRMLSCGTGLLCDIGAAAPGRRSVALRADIDGLAMADTKQVSYRSKVDGVAHGCGHDLHTTVVLGAGLALTQLRPEGLVRLVFEPAEERVPGGAVVVIDDGGLDGIEAVFGFHADPKLEVGTVGVRVGALTSSADMVEVTLHGPGGHTARPHLTVDLVALAGRVAAELPDRVCRLAAADGEPSVVFGSIRSGAAPNVIPTTAVLRGSVRTPDPVARQRAPEAIRAGLREMTDGTAATVDVAYTHGVPPVVNDPAAAATMAEAVRIAIGPDAAVDTPRSTGGDTFAHYQEKVPGCYGRLGVHDPASDTMLDLHSGAFDIDERAIDVGVRVLVTTALAAMDGGRMP